MLNKTFQSILFFQFIFISSLFEACLDNSADLVLINSKIITVDPNFSIARALAIKRDKIIAVGPDDKILKLVDSHTQIIDLDGKTVIPGIIEAHLHPEWASLSELEQTIPDIRSINELLSWIKNQTEGINQGEWIVHPKLFFTRLKELRKPTLSELDIVAPDHPVFLNGTYGGMINTKAMNVSKITESTMHPGIIRDAKTGVLTGFIRASAFSLLKLPPEKNRSHKEKLDALHAMLRRYNKIGITSLCSGAGNLETYSMYQDLRQEDRLTVRILQNILIPFDIHTSKDTLEQRIKDLKYATGDGDEWIRIGALKVLLDGGILTGTAYLREPWGVKANTIYGISDLNYRGILNYTREQLVPLVSVANELGWKFTAHCTGGGGVDLLLDVFEEVNRLKTIKTRRFSIIHGNFFTKNAIERMKRLGVYADMQPAWFYKDADAMNYILGKERIKTFHPYRSLLSAGVVVNGGSDHMVKWNPNTSINPFNPFLGIWTVVTRITERGSVINTSEAITRQEALKMYTINNAYASFEESIKGSIEPGKLADLVVLSQDILTCPEDEIKYIQAEVTIVGGKVVYASEEKLKNK